MKKLFNLALLALTFLLTGTAFGQSSLPACIGSDKSRWSKCFGSWIAPNGNKYVGEWNAATYNGKGSYTFADGENYVGDF